MPKAVCESTLPSPVITRSAVFSFSSMPDAFKISSMPECISALQKAIFKTAIPPAAPAPGKLATSLPQVSFRTRAKFKRSSSRATTSSDVAPFCGPKT